MATDHSTAPTKLVLTEGDEAEIVIYPIDEDGVAFDLDDSTGARVTIRKGSAIGDAVLVTFSPDVDAVDNVLRILVSPAEAALLVRGTYIGQAAIEFAGLRVRYSKRFLVEIEPAIAEAP